MEECKHELKQFLCEDELGDCVLLIMANKQDLPNAMSLEEITEKLDLNRIPPTRTWSKCLAAHHNAMYNNYSKRVPKSCVYTDIQGSCATNGDGLYEGLDWLKTTLTAKHVKKSVSKPTAEVKDFLIGKNGFLSSWFHSLSNYFTHAA